MFTSSIAKFLFILVRIQGELQANSKTIGAEVQRRSRAKRDKKMAMMLVNMGSKFGGVLKSMLLVF